MAHCFHRLDSLQMLSAFGKIRVPLKEFLLTHKSVFEFCGFKG